MQDPRRDHLRDFYSFPADVRTAFIASKKRLTFTLSVIIVINNNNKKRFYIHICIILSSFSFLVRSLTIRISLLADCFENQFSQRTSCFLSASLRKQLDLSPQSIIGIPKLIAQSK